MFRRRISLVATAASLSAVTPIVLRAQDGGDGFLFRAPRATLTVSGGWSLANAGSDLFSFTTEQLTLSRGDFGSFAVAFDLAWPVRPSTFVVAGLSLSGIEKESEFREYIDNNNQPIEQTTTFVRRPLTLGVKQYLVPMGRQIGKYAWIPARVAPYVGAGVGTMYYRFHQTGDFIDFETSEVFASQYESDGWTPTAHARAGMDYSLGGRLALTGDARYTWAKAGLSRDFSGFEKLDLSGFSTTVGLTVRF